MRVERWKRASDIPAAIVFRGRWNKVVIEFGRTRFLPFLCTQLIRTRFLSVWIDFEAWRDAGHERGSSRAD